MKSTAHTFNEENIEYLREYIGDQEVETFLRLEVTTENATPEENYYTNIDKYAIQIKNDRAMTKI